MGYFLSLSGTGYTTTKWGKRLGGEYLGKALYVEYLNNKQRFQGLKEVMCIMRMR